MAIDWERICFGCGECCGPVPFETHFLNDNRGLFQEPVEKEFVDRGLTVPITESMDCVFLNKVSRRCLVYADRPRECRLMGTIPELECPKVKG